MTRPPAMSERLAEQPTEIIDRSERVVFTWRGRPYEGFAGDTIASALAASGIRVLSRSLKYHRPRGVMTATFHDPGCMVQVGDEPNVRGAHRRVEHGMIVTPQNAWPSLGFDVKAANRLVGRFLGAGFYYRTFIAPRWLWPSYQRVLKRYSHGGIIDLATAHGRYDKRYAHPDVVVAGGGPAGMAAAVAATRDGASVMLVEEEQQLGGHLRYGDAHDRAELVALTEQVDAAVETGRLEVLTDAVVAGRYDQNWIGIVERNRPEVVERLIKARAGVLVASPGLLERPFVFAGNDLPGVMLSTAVRRLINLYAVRPGQRAVVMTANAAGDAAVADLERAGVHVVRVLDARVGEQVVEARAGRGRRSVRQVVCSDGARIDADLLVTAVGWTAPTSLLNMAGDRPVYQPQAARFVPRNPPADVLVAGGLAGDGSLAAMLEHAAAVGALAARRSLAVRARRVAGGGGSAPVSMAAEAGPDELSVPALGLDDHPELFLGATDGLVDFSEDVSSKDLRSAANEGYDSIELMKRFTTVTMGPLQGKIENVNAVAALAGATGRTIEETGTTVWRPPYAPISLGALAGRGYEPVRYSPMQSWHEANGAVPLIAGAWIRPDHYGDPHAEVRAVRDAVAIIDITPIGRLDIRGPDAVKLLELVYVNRWAKLAVSGVRYGVMCADDGVVLDDGVTARLGDDHYLMTTTSSGAATVWEWIENWLQTERPDWDVQVTAVTTAYAGINVAGPRSRELLARLVDDIDLDGEAFGYMQVRRGSIAGVADCLVWRIGFTGELSFEINVPAGYGLAIWERLMAAGADLGVRAFGVEAQRILRLEAGHFIVGQDTDGLTPAWGIGIDRMVRLDKDDAVGLAELRWRGEMGGYSRLVGLQTDDPELVPDEASQIVAGERTILGRITSSRFSPTLNRSICLAMVNEASAVPGTKVTIVLPDARRVTATVTEHHAHFDPGKERVRG